MRMWKLLVSLCAVLVAASPFLVHAHASPVQSVPASSAILQQAPESVEIRFSERLEEGASRVVVTNANGEEVSLPALVVHSDPYVLRAQLHTISEGVYTVRWSVVSKDDGHFTRGSFAFAVGTSSIVSSASTVEVIQSASRWEVLSMFVELMGNSVLWGIFILFCVVVRPVFRERSHTFSSFYNTALCIGGALVVIGGSSQALLKTLELAALHGEGFLTALRAYLSTDSGFAILMRGMVGVGAMVLGVLAGRRMAASARFTIWEGVLFTLLLVFAYFRASISHATANPFFPEFSIVVNFLHLIEKDLWAGLVLMLCIAFFQKEIREHFSELYMSASRLLHTLLAAIALSGTYIVWLHLEKFENLRTTQWGEVFVSLLCVAILLIVIRSIHVFLRAYRPFAWHKVAYLLFAAEAAAAIMVVYFSCVQIITSPPPHSVHPFAISALNTENGDIRITFSDSEDGMLLLTVPADVASPTVLLTSEEGLSVSLQERFRGGYVFSDDLLSAGTQLEIIAPRNGGYDARALFTFTEKSQGRMVDYFALVLALCAFGAVVWSLVLLRISSRVPVAPVPAWNRTHALLVFVLALFACIEISFLAGSVYGNTFKKQCMADGYSWHLMPPTRNGVPTSVFSREGCMALGGTFHITDPREYAYMQNPPETFLRFAPGVASAWNYAHIDFTVTDATGTPAQLSLEHERLAHVIVVREDMREFKHVHPVGADSVLSTAAQTSSFSTPVIFESGGTYLVGVDYSYGLSHRTARTTVAVSGERTQSDVAFYPTTGTFAGYEVSMKSSLALTNEISTLIFTVLQDGKPIQDLEPYLGAAMHIAIVKNDLSELIHTHGEVHVPGVPTQTRTHVHAPPPVAFGPTIEAHPVFTSAGDYTVFAEFKRNGKVVVSTFTLEVR